MKNKLPLILSTTNPGEIRYKYSNGSLTITEKLVTFTDKEDAEYVVEACNNYSTAIKLLKSAAKASKNRGGNDYPEIEQFLKQTTV